MKALRMLSLAALCCLTLLSVQAQLQDERHHLCIGLNGGLNLSKMDFNPRIKQQTQQGLSGGITLRYLSEKYFKMLCGVQGEINYSQRGWNELIEDESGDTYYRVMNYIELPLMAHLAFGKDSQTRGLQFFLNAGPVFSMFLSEEEHPSDPFDPTYRPNGVKQQYGKLTERKLDYGLTGGLGIDWATGIGHFLLEGRYYYGLGDIWDNAKKDDFGRSAHTYIGIRLSYLVNLRK